MYFHDKPGWAIALRIVLVLLLIAGMAWITRAAYYQGVAAGAAKMGPGYMAFSGDDDMMAFHHQDGYQDYHGNTGDMFYHHPGTTMPFSGYGGKMGHYSGYAGPMGHYTGGGFATGFFHLLFGALGFFLLVKLIFGFGGMSMYRYGPKGWGPGYHGGHHRYHRCHCPECSGESEEDPAPEKASAPKTKKKAA